MARFHSDSRPGTPPYAREYARLLKNRATLAALRASRAKSPEKKRRALKQASEARSKLKQVEAREQSRASRSDEGRRIFNRLSISEQDVQVRGAAALPERG